MTDGEIHQLDGFGHSISPGDIIDHRPLTLEPKTLKVVKKGCWQGVSKIFSIKYDARGKINVRLIGKDENPESCRITGNIYVEGTDMYGMPWKREFRAIKKAERV